MIKIRLAREGRPHSPRYAIIAANSRRPGRSGLKLEKLGNYNSDLPMEKCLTNIKAEGISKWMKRGAVMSDTVRTLLKKAKITIA